MNISSLTTVVEIAAMIGLLLFRQLRTRRVGPVLSKAVVLLIVLGLAQLVAFVVKDGHVSLAQLLTSVVGLVITGLMAWPRAHSIVVWQNTDGQWFRKGTVWTLLFWIMSFALRLALPVGVHVVWPKADVALSALTLPMILLAFAMSLAIQDRLILAATRSTRDDQR